MTSLRDFDSALYNDLSDCFNAKLDDIDIACFHGRHGLANAGERVAFTLNDRIFIGAESRTPEIIAHEVAHVLQARKRTFSRTDSVRAQEIDANAAARAFANGRHYQCLAARDGSMAAFWDETGHYAATYLAYVNARGSDIAANRAKWCWFPDKVNELAATETAKAHVDESLQELYHRLMRAGNPFYADKNRNVVREIQMGLHCLTGRAQSVEASTRLNNVLEAIKSQDELRIGLALHAFGDAFAHAKLSDPSTMYVAPLGHAGAVHYPDKTYAVRGEPYFERYFFELCYLAKFETKNNFVYPPTLLLYLIRGILPDGNYSKLQQAAIEAFNRNPLQRAADSPTVAASNPELAATVALTDAEVYAMLGDGKLGLGRTEEGCFAIVRSLVAKLFPGAIGEMSEFSALGIEDYTPLRSYRNADDAVAALDQMKSTIVPANARNFFLAAEWAARWTPPGQTISPVDALLNKTDLALQGLARDLDRAIKNLYHVQY